MNSILADRLCKLYPEFFEASDNTCFAQFGFEIDNGWYPLLASLLIQLRELAARTGAKLSVEQIKETLGSLRVHFSCRSFVDSEAIEWARLLVDAAEHLSVTICRRCGRRASRLVGSNWILACCLAHFDDEDWQIPEPQMVAHLLGASLPAIDLSCLPFHPRVEPLSRDTGEVQISLIGYQSAMGYTGSPISAIEVCHDSYKFESLSAARKAIQNQHGRYVYCLK
jgi:hypothetical protein